MALANDGTFGSTYKMLALTGSTNGSHRIFAGTSDGMYIAAATGQGIAFWTNGVDTNRMFITSAGNVGINCTPTTSLTIRPINSSTNALSILDPVGTAQRIAQISFGNATNDGEITLDSNGTNNVRISSNRVSYFNGGAVCIGTTSTIVGANAILHVLSSDAGPTFKNTNSAQQSLEIWSAVSSGDNLFIEFSVNTSISAKGSIDYNRAVNIVRYNTTSDAHLKNIIGDSNLEKSVEILSSTKIKEFSWKEDETNKPQIGVIAQELYETYKGAVSVGSDESLLGTEDYKSWKVDKTAFTFHLIAGWQKHEQMIQEQKDTIKSLQEQINELKNK
jgi:hypothetical protein